MHPHQQSGFCLLSYRCDTCGKQKTVWNSTGQTAPYQIGCLDLSCHGLMAHVEWHNDVISTDPKDWVQASGVLLSRDLMVMALAVTYVDQYGSTLLKHWGIEKGMPTFGHLKHQMLKHAQHAVIGMPVQQNYTVDDQAKYLFGDWVKKVTQHNPDALWSSITQTLQ